MAITEVIKEAIWLKTFLGEIASLDDPIMVFCDNQSVVHLTNDPMFHERTKHIDIRYHFVCDVISEGNVLVKKISTEANLADMLTKPLPIAKFKFCSKTISICCQFVFEFVLIYFYLLSSCTIRIKVEIVIC